MKELAAAGGTQEPLTIPSVVVVYLVTTETLEPPDAGLIVNEVEGDVCPPLETVIEAVPAEAIRLALTEAVN